MNLRHLFVAVFAIAAVPLIAHAENPPPVQTSAACESLADPARTECKSCLARPAPHVYLPGHPLKTRCFPVAPASP